MAEVTAALVKELREKTGAGMMDCKKALMESDGNLESAVDWLRKKGLSAAAKKSGRVAAEGLIAVDTSGQAGAMIELNAETDFVARNETFQSAARTIAALTLASDGTLETVRALPFPGADRSVVEELTHLIASIGENMTLRRSARLSVDDGVVASYVHSSLAPNLGKIGVVVALESTGNRERLLEVGKHLAMHIAAARPEVVSIEAVDPAALDRERSVLADQARASGRPESIIEKMVEGRLRKYYEEVVLLEQLFVLDGKSRVKTVIENLATELGVPVSVTRFERFALGEGIDRAESNFADEVKAATRQ